MPPGRLATTGSANFGPEVSVAQLTKERPSNNAHSDPHRPNNLLRFIIATSIGSNSSFLFRLITGGGSGRLLLVVARVVIVIITAVVVIAFVLRHVDVVQHDADQIAADFLDQLLGANVHRLRIAAVLDDLQ